MFRVALPQPDGRMLWLQTASIPVECCESPVLLMQSHLHLTLLFRGISSEVSSTFNRKIKDYNRTHRRRNPEAVKYCFIFASFCQAQMIITEVFLPVV